VSVKKSKAVKKRRTRKKTSAPVGKHAGGRPPAIEEIDKKLLEQLCAIQCTQAEIAAVLGVSRRTVERYAVMEGYQEIFERGRELGKVSVRRKQFDLMNGDKERPGSVAMAIWLGKQLLGQRDEVTVKSDPNSTTYAGLLQVIDNIEKKRGEFRPPAPTVQ
jgi:hypothetical protein